MRKTALAAAWLMAPVVLLHAQPEEGSEASQTKPITDVVKASTFSTLRARALGPALTSGRIGDLVVNPANTSEWYVAVASGGVWKTDNGGTTFSPIFDGEASYSIGCLAMDPNNDKVIWVGTGENNSQRSVSFGDGVYKSVDGGRSWSNVGLKTSEHIGMIAIDPRDSDVVYVASQGPLWRSGGERGLYKTTDGGETWTRILHVSGDTGINEVHLDPRDPDVIYASAYQRRRRVWTLINGGPESAMYKSEDAGRSWRKINRGLPGGDKGRIGFDISPADPDVLYAIVEAAQDSGGVYRSTDRGESWQKRNSFMASSPQYYNEVVCDPKDVDKVYFLETVLRVSKDGAATIDRVNIRDKHVDDHALWIDPDDTAHMIVGSDGGLYETWNGGDDWDYKPNLPITQFYKVAVDNSEPFYYVYGGTQDNNTLGGPSQTTDRSGIMNEDWFVTVGGDGFEPAIDPEDPNIVYSQWQYGGLVRHDRRSGETVDIKPRERPGDAPYVFNWDSPLIISPHSHTRIYFGGDRLFRSDDRGDSWTPISGDLTRGIDRNTLEVMGKIQSPSAVAKHDSTSTFGNTVSLAESPLVEGLIYVGTDDGLIHVTENGGESWRRIDAFPGVPHMTYVAYLTASVHDENTVFACFDNHKNGDFKPYVLKSTDRGQSWTSIAGDLGQREICYAIAQDHVRPDLLFLGTEFGAFYTLNGGENWYAIRGLPTIAVRDVEIQRRENDLVMATFGRGFFVLDDYSPLQTVRPADFEHDAYIFPVKDALRYTRTSRGRGSQGASFYSASNPSFGASFTYHMKRSLRTKREQRERGGWSGKAADYPTLETYREEDRENEPAVILEIRNGEGKVVARLDASRSDGVHRVVWDLRGTPHGPASTRGASGRAPMVPPGTYSATISKVIDGVITQLGDPREFEVTPLDLATFAAEDFEEKLAFETRVSELQGAVDAANRILGEASDRVGVIIGALRDTPGADVEMMKEALELKARVADLSILMYGDRAYSRFQEPAPPSINERIRWAASSFSVSSAPTGTQREQYGYAADAFAQALADLRGIVDDIEAMGTRLDEVGAPWTPGRFPTWSRD